MNTLRLDPSRTGFLRARWMRDFRGRFADLKRRLKKLIEVDDALGLSKPDTYTLNAREYASTQLDVTSIEVVAALRQLRVALDPADVLKVEEEPHITVRFGLHDTEPTRARLIVSQHGPLYVTLGGLSLFSNTEQDVLKLDVERNEELWGLYSHLGVLPNTKTHPDYQPHLTVAYLKPGTGAKYLNESTGLSSVNLVFRSVTYSNQLKEHYNLPLGGVTANYNPSQTRVPAGSSEGGQWATGGAGDVGITPPSSDGITRISSSDVLNTVADTRNAWGYKEPISLRQEEGPEFEKGGKKWKEGGNCHLETGSVTVWGGNDWKSVDDVRHLTAHEFMHGTYEKVTKRYLEEYGDLSSSEIRADGKLKPEFETKYPTYARMYDLIDKPGLRKHLEEDDGVTEYSQAYWKEYKEGKVTYHIAVHETLAEIAGLHERSGVIKGSKVYKDLYKATRDEYKILTEQKKRPRAKAIVTNEAQFVDHEAYFDAEFRPVPIEKATWIRYWKADGTNGWLMRADSSSGEPTVNSPWRFLTTTQKLEEFKKWLKQEIALTILAKHALSEEDAWLKEYIAAGYRKGMERAFADTRRHGMNQPLDFYQGTKAEFLRSSFGRPVSIERVKLLASRAFDDLKGITEPMSNAISRELVDGMIRGDSPKTVASKIAGKVDVSKARALTIARTETMRAHAEGALDAFEALGVEKIGFVVEWSTSKLGVTGKGNPSPCEICAPLQGLVLKIEEARGMLPRHPNCMCVLTPANVGEKTKGQIRGRERIVAAIERSLAGEISKKAKKAGRTIAQQRKLSNWAGARNKIAKKRPRSIL